MTVVDASALLAFLQGEDGAEQVESALDHARIGAADWSEVARKTRSGGADWGIARALLLSFGLQIEPVTAADAERAAALWKRGSGLSLTDRLCLALAERLDLQAMTADRAWGSSGRVVQIRPSGDGSSSDPGNSPAA